MMIVSVLQSSLDCLFIAFNTVITTLMAFDTVITTLMAFDTVITTLITFNMLIAFTHDIQHTHDTHCIHHNTHHSHCCSTRPIGTQNRYFVRANVIPYQEHLAIAIRWRAEPIPTVHPTVAAYRICHTLRRIANTLLIAASIGVLHRTVHAVHTQTLRSTHTIVA